MNGTRTRIQPTLEPIAVMLVPGLILVVGVMWCVQPRVAAALRADLDIRTLEGRAAMVRETAARAGAAPATDTSDVVREFERRVAAADCTAAVAEAVAHLVLDPPDLDAARNLQIEAGNPVRNEAAALAGAPQVTGVSGTTGPDPRFTLFPMALGYTPVTVGFESTYERAGSFLWNLRDLPTIVEVSSLEITRALPLVHVNAVLFVFRRLPPAPVAPAQVPSVPSLVPSQLQSQRQRLTAPGGMQ